MIALDNGRILYEIDRTTGTKVVIGAVSANAGTTGGLAYDAVSGTLYLTSTSLDSVYTLDLATGEATLIGAYNDDVVMHGIEWNSGNNTLYGGSRGNVYSIDTTTGQATLLITSGLTSFANLVYDSLNDDMYMTHSGDDSFYSVDLDASAISLIGPLSGPTNPNGLAYVPEDDAIYMVDNSTDTLYTIDRTTGAATTIGSTGAGNLLGLVWIPDGGGSVCPSCAADYDQDGGVTGGDLAAFFTDYETGAACADVDQDGGVTGGDLAFFFAAYEAGGC
jgi:DNA-binding beta-propeller fold protein YncE